MGKLGANEFLYITIGVFLLFKNKQIIETTAGIIYAKQPTNHHLDAILHLNIDVWVSRIFSRLVFTNISGWDAIFFFRILKLCDVYN
jgi:hypothetical protein